MSFTGCATADSQWLLITLGEADEPATMKVCADSEALLHAVQEAMFFSPEGETLDAESTEQAKAVVAELIEDGKVTFEGDPGFHLYRVWKSREQAIADVRGMGETSGEAQQTRNGGSDGR